MSDRAAYKMLLTAVTILAIWPPVSGAILSALSLALSIFVPANTGLAPAGLLVSALVYPPPAAITGLPLAVFSRRIRTEGAWLGYAALAGATLTLASLLIVFRSIFTEGPLDVGLYVVAGLTFCGMLGALAAAAATFRLRPKPPLLQAAPGDQPGTAGTCEGSGRVVEGVGGG